MPNDVTSTALSAGTPIPPIPAIVPHSKRTCPVCKGKFSALAYRLKGAPVGQKCSKTCLTCHDRNVWCTDTGAPIGKVLAKHHNGDGKYYSLEYWDAHYFDCSACGNSSNVAEQKLPPPHLNEYGDYKFCADCYAQRYGTCDSCLVEQLRSNLYDPGHTGAHTCRACARINWRECAACGSWIRRDNLTCAYCVRRERERQAQVHGYGHKPSALFFHTGKDNRPVWIEGSRYLDGLIKRTAQGVVYYDDLGFPVKDKDSIYRFGFELEAEAPGSEEQTDAVIALHSRAIMQGSKKACDVYCKRDGSLGAYGFEIVSHPLTYGYWRLVRGEFEALFASMREAGIRSYNTNSCGLHIHMNKSAWSQLAIYKLQKLIYENPAWVLKLSGRKCADDIENYSSVSNAGRVNSNLAAKVNELRVKKGQIMEIDYERYVAVNLRNANTIELRFFKGTLNFGTFERNLQFGVCVHRYCMHTGIKAIGVDSFKAFALNPINNDCPMLQHYFGKTKMQSGCFPKIAVSAIVEQKEEKYKESNDTIAPLTFVAPQRCEGDTRRIDDVAIERRGREYRVWYGDMDTFETLDNARHCFNLRTHRYEPRDINAVMPTAMPF